MTLTGTCGKLATGVSVLVVLIALGLLVLMLLCVCLGAYVSSAGTNATSSAQDYQELQQNISSATGQIHQAVPGGG